MVRQSEGPLVFPCRNFQHLPAAPKKFRQMSNFFMFGDATHGLHRRIEVRCASWFSAASWVLGANLKDEKSTEQILSLIRGLNVADGRLSHWRKGQQTRASLKQQKTQQQLSQTKPMLPKGFSRHRAAIRCGVGLFIFSPSTLTSWSALQKL